MSSRSSFIRKSSLIKDVLHDIGREGKAATMGDEAQKRNTDCVYFLASPLTCKKGADCEYRHSEAARVNPRDCWYWLSGNCLNANCSFRHPPLDGRPGVSASTPSQVAGGTSAATTMMTPTAAIAVAPSIPSTSTSVSAPPIASKPTVPCFFFTQGFCAKGGKCPFLHGPSTQYRKEATTYQRPQVSEQPANGEGNGVSHGKQQSQDRKPASQIKAPARAALPSQEAGFYPSNVYKLSASGVPAASGKRLPGNAGEKVEQTLHVGRSKPVYNADDIIKHAHVVESRISQAQYSNECIEQFFSGEKNSMKGQLAHVDLGRMTKQGRQSSATYIARTSDAPIGLEMQDLLYEPEGQQSARELHADDLRNHLKRKKNDSAYSVQVRDFHAKEFSKDRLEGGRLASRAVSVAESKDFVPKRAKQDKESSTFSGPKSLAQIKAEKSKAVMQGSLKAEDSMDDCTSVEPDLGERKDTVDSSPTLHVNVLPESRKESLGDHSGTSVEETKTELKEIDSTVACEVGGTCQNSRPDGGVNNSNGSGCDLAPLSVSKEAETSANHSSKVSISNGRESLTNEETLAGSRRVYHAVVGTHTEAGYASADEAMEDAVADAEYASDYDEEDDFARKLGSFLS